MSLFGDGETLFKHSKYYSLYRIRTNASSKTFMTNKFTATRKGFNIIIVLVCGTEDAGLGERCRRKISKKFWNNTFFWLNKLL
jgi:hypothetical protein